VASGTEYIYTIYAESSKDQAHLDAMVAEAQEIVHNARPVPRRGLAMSLVSESHEEMIR